MWTSARGKMFPTVYSYVLASKIFYRQSVSVLQSTWHAVSVSFVYCVKLIYDDLRDLALFVQFKKREKNPGRSVTFSKVAGYNLQLYWR